MRKILLTSVALFLVTGTAHTRDEEPLYDNIICYQVLRTSDNFVAMRRSPTTKSKIIWASREGDILTTDPKDIKNQKNWVYVVLWDVMGNYREGWVYKKYISEFSCGHYKPPEPKCDIHGCDDRPPASTFIPGLPPQVPMIDDKR